MPANPLAISASDFFGLPPQIHEGSQIRWLQIPGVTLFVMLVAADLIFMGLHVLWANDFLDYVLFAITKDRGYSEIYQYVKEFWIVLLLFVCFCRRRYFGYIPWIGLFCYALLDDAMQLHERLGGYLVDVFALAPQFGLRGQDFGEAAVSFTALVLFAPFVSVAYLRGSTYFKQICRVLAVLVAALGMFGVGVDMVHSVFESQAYMDTLLAIVEDGGEMVVVSLIVSYCYWLLCDERDEATSAEL